MQQNPYAVKLSTYGASLWNGASPLLTALAMDLTERCNNNCIHCYINLPADDLDTKEKELSSEQVKSVLEEAASLGCLSVRLTGGEPLLREDFENLYIFARRLGMRVIISTNATLITDKLAKLFANIPPLEPLDITVYGMKKGSYESVTRVPGSFEGCRRGIDLLLEHGVPFLVKGALLPPNREEMAEFQAWASTISWMEKPPSYSMFFDLRCRRDSVEKNRLLKQLRLTPEEGLKVLSRREAEYQKEMREFCSKFTAPPGERLFSCGAGVRSGCVDAYAYFQPCTLLRHPETIYDLKRGSLKDALMNFFPRVRDRRAIDHDYLVRCARCFLKNLCEQCPAKSWLEHGTLDSPVEYFCEITHAQARHLGLLTGSEMAWDVKDWKQRVRGFCGEE